MLRSLSWIKFTCLLGFMEKLGAWQVGSPVSWREQNEWCYQQELEKVYVKLDQFEHPFQNVSIDPLGYLEGRAFSKSRKIVKLWPLLGRCLDKGAVLCLLMETMETKSICNALLRFQLRVGCIDKVSMNSGMNLFELRKMSEVSNGLLKKGCWFLLLLNIIFQIFY